MKTKLNLLCICVLIGVFLSTSTAISIVVQSGIAGYKAGIESVKRGEDLKVPNYKMICTLPSNLLAKPGSVTNLKDSSQVAIMPIVSLVEVPKESNSAMLGALNSILCLLAAIIGLFSVIQFYKLIRNINRGDIFSWKNVKFLRKLGWALIVMFICSFGIILLGNYEAAQVVTLNGCKYSNTFAFSEPTFILGAIALLVAEVFAVGLKMKEEQDLTI